MVRNMRSGKTQDEINNDEQIKKLREANKAIKVKAKDSNIAKKKGKSRKNLKNNT